METTTSTFRIPDERFGEFEERIEKANRKARRLRLPAISYTVIHDERIERKVGTTEVFDPETGFTREIPKIRVDWYRFIEVTGNRPHVAGWTFLGTLDFEPGGVIFSAAPEQTIPEQYRNAASTACDHCHTTRRRKNTFVLRNDSTTATQVIGRNCLADFLGTASASELLARFEFDRFLADLSSCEDEGEGSGSRRSTTESTLGYLTHVAACIRTLGWVSGQMARNATEDHPLCATSSSAWANMYPSPEAKRRGDVILIIEADVALAKAAFEWAPSIEGDSDYCQNVRVLFASQEGSHVFTAKHSGTVASVVAVYLRHLDRLEERKRVAPAVDEFFGTVKVRGIFTLRLEAVKTFESDWGVTTLFRFIDEAGRPAVWFSSNAPVLNGDRELALLHGYTFRVKATVKAHEIYRDRKQTTLTRLVVEEIVAEPEQVKGQALKGEVNAQI
jgi:hypothetical protein